MYVELEVPPLLKFSCTKINRNVFSSCCYVIIKWLDGTDIKTGYTGIGWVVVDWIYLALDRENFQAVENTVHKMRRFSCLAEEEQVASTGLRVVELDS